MNKTILGICLGLTYSLVWSQSSRTLPPPPPPPNPASVSNLGSPSFYLFQNNLKPAQPQAPSGNILMSLKYGDAKDVLPSTVPSSEYRPWQFPKSFESSIYGLQFVKPNPGK